MSIKKLVFGLAAVAVVFGMTFVPASAPMTVAEQLQLIETLSAQIAALQSQLGVSAPAIGSSSCAFTRDLTDGVEGADVTCLQDYLKSTGHFPVTTSSTGYFGPITMESVAAWQAANGVTPSVGYFGSLSQSKYYSMVAVGPLVPLVPPVTSVDLCPNGNTLDSNCTLPPGGETGPTCPNGFLLSNNCQPVDGTGTGTTGLTGGAGSILTADFISSLNNEEVGEGAEDVEVAGIETEADDGSDISLRAITLDFDKVGNVPGSDDNFDDYADEVSVWFEGEEIARVDANTFDDDNNYTRTITLDSGVIIRAGETKDLVIAVSGINNLDSGNATEDWTVTIVTVRFQDGQGAIVSEAAIGGIGDTRQFSFENFASAANTELKFSNGDDKFNDARTIGVEADDDTNNETFFSFEMEAEGNSDIELKDLPIFWTAVGANVEQIINSVELFIDGKSVGTENVSIAATTGTTTISDIDYVILAGTKVEALVKVDINDLDSNFTEGDTLKAEIGEIQTDSTLFDAEDEKGNNLADGDKTGSATTDAHAFYANGIQVVFVSSSVDTTSIDGNDNDHAIMLITFDVTAFGEDNFLPNVLTQVSSSTSATGGTPTLAQGIGYHLQYSANVGTTASSSVTAVVDSTTADEETNAFEVREGTTERFTVKVTHVNAGAIDGTQIRTILTGINFADTDSATGDSIFTSNLQQNFRSPYVGVLN